MNRELDSEEPKEVNSQDEKTEIKMENSSLDKLLHKYVIRIKEWSETRSSPQAQPDVIFKEVERLRTAPFEVKEYFNTQLIDGLILRTGWSRILDEAQHSTEKWLVKRGKELTDSAKKRMAEFQIYHKTQSACIREIKPHLKTRLEASIIPQSFCNRITKQLKMTPIPKWKEILEKEVKAFNIRQGIPEEDLRVLAHLTAKLVAKFYYNP